MNAKRIRAGLYQAGPFLVEDVQDADGRWTWRLSDMRDYHDPWRGDFDTKRAALQSIPR